MMPTPQAHFHINPRVLTFNIGRKKLPLDVILDNEPRQLLRGYNNDQLHDLFLKVHEVGGELDRILDTEGEVKEILGTKMEGKTMWFYVKWDNNQASFIPARVLNRFAPNKVIQYYESILQFQPGPEEEQPNKPVKTPPLPNKPQPKPTNQNHPPVVEIRPNFHTIHCTGCSILLQYPDGTKAIKCPICNSIMVVPRT